MALWTPAETTTALWLDAADSSTLFDAVSGGSTPADGGSILRWEDKSGNGRHVTNASGANRPTRQTSSLGGAARFDGAGDRLAIGASDIWRNINGGLIAALRLTTNASAIRYICDIRTNNSAAVRALLEVGRTLNKSNVGGRRADADSFAFISSSANVSASYELQIGEYDYANAALRLWINGSLAAQNTSFQTAGFTDNTTSGSVTIGSANNGALGFLGDIAELVITHSIADRQKLEGYMLWDRGLESLLPADHPYKDAAPTIGGGIIPILRQHYAAQGAR